MAGVVAGGDCAAARRAPDPTVRPLELPSHCPVPGAVRNPSNCMRPTDLNAQLRIKSRVVMGRVGPSSGPCVTELALRDRDKLFLIGRATRAGAKSLLTSPSS